MIPAPLLTFAIMIAQLFGATWTPINPCEDTTTYPCVTYDQAPGQTINAWILYTDTTHHQVIPAFRVKVDADGTIRILS